MNKLAAASSPRRAAFLAVSLLVVGFLVGYGYGYGIRRVVAPAADPAAAERWAPVTEGLRISPDDRLLAFTGIYAQSQRSSRFVLDLKTGGLSAVESPGGWQDYMTQWGPDGRTLLFEREKIPRPVDAATAGLYQEKITPGQPVAGGGTGKGGEPHRGDPALLTEESLAPPGEKVTAGFWAPDGKLVVKTRNEPKALYEVRDGHLQFIDRARVTYYQNRAVAENGHNVYYVVRDMAGQPQASALYRVQDGQARQLGGAMTGLVWAYVAENARWMIACRQASNGTDWAWTLYRVSPNGVQSVKTNDKVPGDVITVYWSPDFKYVLGASGQSLWLIDIPALTVRQVGSRSDWKADDAIWLNHASAAVVAAGGRMWKVALPSGTATEIWKFPDPYWR